jgi:hypothetical protein
MYAPEMVNVSTHAQLQSTGGGSSGLGAEFLEIVHDSPSGGLVHTVVQSAVACPKIATCYKISKIIIHGYNYDVI